MKDHADTLLNMSPCHSPRMALSPKSLGSSHLPCHAGRARRAPRCGDVGEHDRRRTHSGRHRRPYARDGYCQHVAEGAQTRNQDKDRIRECRGPRDLDR